MKLHQYADDSHVYMSSFAFLEEIAPRKTAENTAKHRDGGVGSVVANHRGGSESSVVVTTLDRELDIGNEVWQ